MKILIVDDESTNRLVLKGMLEKDAHQVIVAEDGAQAVERFRDSQPEMVLMDIMMPVMDGYEATKIIKAECGDTFVPVIFLTALSGDDAMVSCIEHGGDDFLRKPYDRNILQAKISALARIRDLYNTVRQQKTELQAFQEHTVREHEVAEKIFENVMSYGKQRQVECTETLRHSAEAFNGDLVLAAANPVGDVNVLVGDFTGHGLAAAIGALPVAEVFYKMTNKGYAISEIAPEINNKLRDLLPVGRFLAVCLITLERSCHRISVWNGGVPEVLITRGSSGEIVKRIHSNRLPLGVQSNGKLNCEPDIYDISPGDCVHIYTDGVIETVDEQGNMFGQERLEALIGRTSENLLQTLEQELLAFRGTAAQADDVTYLRLHCDPQKMGFDSMETDNYVRRGAGATSWRTALELGFDALRQTDPLPMLLQNISEIQGMSSHRSHLFTILSELYNNALEHGLLGLNSEIKDGEDGFSRYYQERETRLKALSSGGLSIELSNHPNDDGGILEIVVRDTGKGFEEHEFVPLDSDVSRVSGRGLGLVMALCDTVEFSSSGNCVKATYRWKAD